MNKIIIKNKKDTENFSKDFLKKDKYAQGNPRRGKSAGKNIGNNVGKRQSRGQSGNAYALPHAGAALRRRKQTDGANRRQSGNDTERAGNNITAG